METMKISITAPFIAFIKHSRPIIKAFILLYLLFIVSNPALSQETGKVQKVYDGDTVLLSDGRKVRYLGMNTPEWQEPYYLKAKRLNESLVMGKEVRLEFDEERADKYGRLLAYLYVGNQMVNAKLIEDGLAHAFFIPPNRKHNALLLKLQADARERKSGIWSRRGKMSVLKITSVHPSRSGEGELFQPYSRIANISNMKVNLAGYTFSSETGPSFKFPDIELAPGYTVLCVSGKGKNSLNSEGQLIVYWNDQPAKWDEEEDTAYLTAPDGTLIDSYHYKGRRVSRKPRQ
jgi:endonuclease YncB( thermonuclease family)